MIVTRFARAFGASASSATLALALVAGGVVALNAAPAAAAAKEKEKPGKADYSKAFIEVYNPLNDMVKGEAFDAAAANAQIPAVVAAATTADDKFAAGNIVLNVGQKTGDKAVQQQGLEMMLASGKTPADKLGLIAFSAGQLAYVAKDYAKARGYLEQALAANYTENDPRGIIAETYFNEGNYAGGVNYIGTMIEAQRAAGQPVSQDWVKRAVAMSYNNKLNAEANKYALMYAKEFPSTSSWGDAVAILLNTSSYQNPEILDLMRLARATGSFRDARMFQEYLDAADYRRLPAEVVAVIDEGYAKGFVQKSDLNVADTRKQAADRVAIDQREFDTVLKEGRSSSSFTSVMAAGDLLLSMDKGAEAEEFYTKALGTSGANTALVLTRLGIAQFKQGKYAEAQATFAKVDGPRKPIADLWSTYAAQKALPTAVAATAQ